MPDCICAIDANYSFNTQMPTSGGSFTTNLFTVENDEVDLLMVERSEEFMLSTEERDELYTLLLQNRHLRCLLYLGASCNYRLKKNDPIYLFNKKKRQQSQSPLRSKAANIAAAHKLLIVIYALSRSGVLYRS